MVQNAFEKKERKKKEASDPLWLSRTGAGPGSFSLTAHRLPSPLRGLLDVGELETQRETYLLNLRVRNIMLLRPQGDVKDLCSKGPSPPTTPNGQPLRSCSGNHFRRNPEIQENSNLVGFPFFWQREREEVISLHLSNASTHKVYKAFSHTSSFFFSALLDLKSHKYVDMFPSDSKTWMKKILFTKD